MPDKRIETSDEHLNYLDSARGIAAIMVIVYHFINWHDNTTIRAKLGSVIFNGSDAVSFFFVLSGFVLSYKYIVSGQPLDIKKFYVNRLFRLWPAFFITIVLNVLNVNIGNFSPHNLADIFILNKTKFWEEAFLLRSRPNVYIPGWTLVLELSMSFFLPFIIVLAKKDKRLVYWLLFAFIIIGNTMRDLYMFHVHFTLGVLISCLFYKINDPSFKETNWYRYRFLILSMSFLLFSVRHIDRIFPFNSSYTYFAQYLGIDFFHFSGIASFVFIVAIIHFKKIKKILTNKFLLFLGKISYGIYLMHWLLVVDIFKYYNYIPFSIDNKLGFTAIFLIYTAATILLAVLLHYFIEMPFIRIGKRIKGRMKPSFRI